jgi:hypothetical protein
MYDAAQIAELLPFLTGPEKREVEAILAHWDRVPWRPLPGPQTMAYESKADIVGFGGAAGGGKTDLACGSIITKHQKAMVLQARRHGADRDHRPARKPARLEGRL